MDHGIGGFIRVFLCKEKWCYSHSLGGGRMKFLMLIILKVKIY